MPKQLINLPQFKWADQTWQTEPLTNAISETIKRREQREQFDITKREQARQFDATNAIREQQLELQRSRYGQEDEERRKKEYAGIAQSILDEPNPQIASGMWGKLTGSHPEFGKLLTKYGVDPKDHVTGAKFIVAQALGPVDPDTRTVRQAQAKWYEQRGDAAQQNADTRRIKAYGDVLAKVGDNPTQQQWEAHNAPGGIIHATFGRAIPYEQAPHVLHLARAGSKGKLDEQGLLDLGISPDAVRELQTQRSISEALNRRPKVGHEWQIKDGKIREVANTEGSESKEERQARKSASYHAKAIRDAEKVMTNSWAPEWMPYNPYRYAAGSANMGEIGQAFGDYEQSVLGMVYMLSGKQTAVKEMEAFLKTYKPEPGDSTWRIREKTKRIRGYMGHLTGVDMDKEFPDQPDKKEGKKKEGRPDYKGLSNEEILRQLNE